MRADITSYYDKPQTLVTYAAVTDNYISHKYEDRRSTYYSFGLSCGGDRPSMPTIDLSGIDASALERAGVDVARLERTMRERTRLLGRHGFGGFQAYGPKSKFKDLFEYALDSEEPVEVVVVADRARGDVQTYTLLSWRRLDGAAPAERPATEPTTPAASGDPVAAPQVHPPEVVALCRRLKVDPSSLHGERITMITTVLADDYYGHKYKDAEATHHAFRVTCPGLVMHAYGPKHKFQGLFDLALDAPSTLVSITFTTDASHQSNTVFTLLDWERY